jgi:hypothetical protein
MEDAALIFVRGIFIPGAPGPVRRGGGPEKARTPRIEFTLSEI